MEETPQQSAGNGDWTAKDINRGIESAAASLEDLDRRVPPLDRFAAAFRGWPRRGRGIVARQAGIEIVSEAVVARGP